MAIPVVSGAALFCTNGLSPGVLNVVSQGAVLLAGAPAATIADTAPMAAVGPCGMCTSLANPTVASATAAALGVLTPMPCIPAPVGTWQCSPAPLISGIPGLVNDGTLLCSYGGSIRIQAPGQTQVVFS